MKHSWKTSNPNMYNVYYIISLSTFIYTYYKFTYVAGIAEDHLLVNILYIIQFKICLFARSTSS